MIDYMDLLIAAAPEGMLVLTALAVLALDMAALKDLAPEMRRIICGLFSLGGCVTAAVVALSTTDTLTFPRGVIVQDALVRWPVLIILVLASLTILVAASSGVRAHLGEYFAVLLMATVGMLFLVTTEHLLMLFVSLELTSICLYVLVAMERTSPAATEAGLKYFLFGGVASAFTLFGLSFLYGLTGTTSLVEIAAGFADGTGRGPLSGSGASGALWSVALVLILAGFGFKIAAVPFHLWAPDVYQAAPLSSAALIASGSKVAGFFVLAKVMLLGFGRSEAPSAYPQWVSLLAVIAAGSMVFGNLAALAQSSVRRLLAYSAVAHAGYMLLGVVSPGAAGVTSLVYYAATYGLATVGAFAAISTLEDDHMTSFAGLHSRSPFLAAFIAIFFLSLAGIPPLAGFLGKFLVFAAALQGEQGQLRLVWLVVLAVGASAVSLYYYLRVLKQMYVVQSGLPPLRIPMPTWVALVVCAAGTVGFGCVPGPFLQSLLSAARASAM